LSKKIEFTKEELKNPDQVLANLKQGFEWSAAHSKMVLTVLFGFIIIGGGWTAYSIVQDKKDGQRQEAFYLAEKKYLDARKKLEDAQKPKVDEKKNAKTPPTPIEPKASTNPEVDYAEAIQDLRKVTEANPTSKAGIMAALTLSEIYRHSEKLPEALKALELSTQGKATDLLSALAFKTKGNLQADLDQCANAVQTWQQLSHVGSFAFLTSDVKLKMALCYEKMDQAPQAEVIYKELIDRMKNPGQQADKSDDSAADKLVGREAEKFLRLMKLKKDQRGS